MQCFRCGADLPIGDGHCPACGSELPYGENFCNECGTAMLCERCRGAPGEVAAAATPGSAADPTDGLQYEYRTITVPLKVYRREHESLPSFYARVHQYLVDQTQAANLDGWETVDALDYEWLDRQGLVDHSILGFLSNRPARSVTLRFKRLTGGPPDSEGTGQTPG